MNIGGMMLNPKNNHLWENEGFKPLKMNCEGKVS